VVDGKAGFGAEPLEQVAPQPAGASLWERRDDDLVDALVVNGVQRRGERIRVDDLAMSVDPLCPQQRKRAAKAPVGLQRRDVIALRSDE
jgi:hypothetical protein